MLGTSLGSVDIVRKAQGMGCHVIVTDGLAPEASRAKLVADESWPIDTGNVGALEERCRAEGVGGVFAGVSEFNLDRTIELCGRLGLPCYIAPEGWETARNKGRFLDICHREGVPTADQYAPDPALMDQAVTELATGGVRDATRARLDEELAAVRFPVVVKPVDCSGNQGISFCDTPEELVRAWQLVRQVSENPRVVVEQRLVGDEFSIVYALVGGQARMLRLGATYNEPGHPPNIYDFGTTISTGYCTYLRDVDPGVRRVLAASGCRDGIASVQAIRTADGVFHLFELGYRLTADMGYDKMIAMTGFDAIQWLLDFQLGRGHEADELPRPPERPMRESSNVYFFFAAHAGTIASIRGLEELEGTLVDDPQARRDVADDHIAVDMLAQEGMEVTAGRLMGKLTFHAYDAAAVVATLRHINARVSIRDERGRDLVVRFSRYADLLAAEAQEQAPDQG